MIKVSRLKIFLKCFFFFFSSLGTSQNLSWRGGGVEEKLGGLQFFLDGIWGGLKMPKDDLGGGVVKFLLSSIPTEQHDA